MKTQQKNFTTTFPLKLLQWLDETSKQLGVPKKEIIEQALEKWKKDFIRQEIRKSYRKVKKDPEMKFFAEAGMEDYFNQINE